MPELNVTMVAFDGDGKPEPLTRLREDVLRVLTDSLPPESASAFTSYEVGQTHATMIGMEVDGITEGCLVSLWFKRNRGQQMGVEVHRIAEIARSFVEGGHLFTIRFGGFPEGYCRCRDECRQALDDWACTSNPGSFHSCDRSAYEGSFYAYAPGPVLITGWPVAGPSALESFPHQLYGFRRALEDGGLLDKYHSDERPHWKDDDFYIRVGTFTNPLPADRLRATERAVRDYLSARGPVTVDVNVEDVSIVLYDDPSLAPGHVKDRVPLSRLLENPAEVRRLYERVA